LVANDAGSGDDRVPLVLVVFLLLQLNQVSGAGISTVDIGAGALISGGSRIVFGGMSIATRISLVTLLHSLTLVRISRLRLDFLWEFWKYLRKDGVRNVGGGVVSTVADILTALFEAAILRFEFGYYESFYEI
jgi:hypothetical protein